MASRTGIPGADSSLSWQAQFDRWFPDGAFVQVIRDVPEEEDSVTYICPRLVVGIEDAANPGMHIVDPGVKSMYVTLDRIEDYASDETHIELLATMVEGDPLPQQYRFSSYLTDEARATAKEIREGNRRKYQMETR